MRGSPRDPNELRALRDRGLSQGQAAKILGCTPQNVSARCRYYGIKWPMPRGARPAPRRRWSRRAPDLYELGISLEGWYQILGMIEEMPAAGVDRRRACYQLSSRLGIPYGAIAAADRGEWHRLQ